MSNMIRFILGNQSQTKERDEGIQKEEENDDGQDKKDEPTELTKRPLFHLQQVLTASSRAFKNEKRM